MKHHPVTFVCLCISTLLAALPRSAYAGNLQLIIEGPFVVCENVSGAAMLTIAIPVLAATPLYSPTHYPPTLSGNFGDVSLGTGGNLSQYHVATYDLESNLTIVPAGPSGPPPSTWGVKKGPNTEIYYEAGDCGPLKPNLASYQLTTPIPDTITAYRPLEYKDRAYVVDSKHKPVGPCPKPCAYGTRLVLHYSNVDLGKVRIQTTCSSNLGPCTPEIETGGDYDDFTLDPGDAIDGSLEINLIANPASSTLSTHKHATKSFAEAISLLGVDRTWSYTSRDPRNPILHAECQAAAPVYCRNCRP